MKCLLAIVVLGVAALAAATVATISHKASSHARTVLAEELGAMFGAPVILRGEPIVTLFPRPAVSVDDDVVSGGSHVGSPPLLAIPSLKAALRIPSLLKGRFEVATLRLDDATLRVGGDRRAGGGDGVAVLSLRLKRQQDERTAELSGSLASRLDPDTPVRFAGTLTTDAESLTIQDARVRISGSSAKGSLTVDLGGERPAVRGSLAFENLDLAAFRDAIPAVSFSDLLALPVPVRWLELCDADLGVSADSIDLGGVELPETVARLVIRDGRMRLDLDTASAKGSRMAAVATMREVREGAAFRVRGRIEGLSVGDASRVVREAATRGLVETTEDPLMGKGDATFDISARGATIGAVLRSLEGHARAEVREGSAYGADLEETLSRLVEGEMTMVEGKPFIPLAGRTRFARLTARMAFGSGTARAEEIRFTGGRFEILLNGRLDLRSGEIEAGGSAFLFGRDEEARPLVELPYGIGGTVREPSVAPGILRIRQGSDKTAAEYVLTLDRIAGHFESPVRVATS